MAAINGKSNGYPEGQCTRYADEQYHTLTGYYVPWSANAKDWYIQALAYGWTVSSKPIVPSIICLQGGIQGADGAYGHVAIVESINGKSVTTTDLNWGPNYQSVSTVVFGTGSGVSFIYATGGNGKAIGATTATLSDSVSNLLAGGNTPISLAPNSDVTDFLWTLDQIMLLINPFSNVNATQDSLPGGITFTDPISWLELVAGNLVDDLVALCVRLIFIIVGVVVLIKVMSNFIDFGAVASTASSGLSTLAMGAML